MIQFSVVVPVHNEEHFLSRTLPSIFDLGAGEYVFLLDRCTDRSYDLVKRFSCGRSFVVRLSNLNGSDFRSRIAYLRWLGRQLASNDVVVEVDADLILGSDVKNAIHDFVNLSHGCISFLHLDYPICFRNLLKRLYVRLGLPFGWLGSVLVYRKSIAKRVEDLNSLKHVESAEDTHLVKALTSVGSTKCFISGTVHLRPKTNSFLQGKLSWTVGKRGLFLGLVRGLGLLDFNFIRGYIYARLS